MVNEDFILFVSQFRSTTGIDLSHYNQAQIQRRLNVFQQKHQLASLAETIYAIRKDENLLQEVLDRLTINVTNFFRDKPFWDTLRDNVSDLARVRIPLKLWSAGCSTGEEAYSLAYMVSNMLPKNRWELRASDLDARALTTARSGIYRAKALKGLDPKDIGNMFNKMDDDVYLVKDRIKERVNFFRHDLLQDKYPLGLDIVLCRNVIIYFKERAKKEVISKIAQSLNPQGILFLGGSEQIMRPEDYGLVNESLFFYKKGK